MAIEFVNIRNGERKRVTTEPMISAYFNSTNLHVNATVGQDFGWRLAPSTVKRMRAIQNDPQKMAQIAATFQLPLDGIGQTDVLNWISREDAQAAAQSTDETDYERQYEEELRSLEDSAPTKKAAREVVEKSRTVNRDAGDGQFVSDEEAEANPKTTVTETVTKASGNKTNSNKQAGSAKIESSSNDSKES